MKAQLLFSVICLAAPISAVASTVSIVSTRDTSIFSDTGTNNANGGGESFIVGTNNTPEYRRGLLFFDLSAIPSNAVIEGISLKLTLTKAPIGETARLVSLHRSLASWGENPASNAGSGGGAGSGILAEIGDATWLTRFFQQGPAWTTAGGDFVPAASATTSVTTALMDYTWSGAGMVADVQGWVGTPANNFGWFVLGDESASRTNRQFFTHESTTANTAPTLTVTYSVPEPNSPMFLLIGGAVMLILIPYMVHRSRVQPGSSPASH